MSVEYSAEIDAETAVKCWFDVNMIFFSAPKSFSNAYLFKVGDICYKILATRLHRVQGLSDSLC